MSPETGVSELQMVRKETWFCLGMCRPTMPTRVPVVDLDVHIAGELCDPDNRSPGLSAQRGT